MVDQSCPPRGPATQGMEYLHTKSIVHFDLKSANLLVGYRERTPM